MESIEELTSWLRGPSNRLPKEISGLLQVLKKPSEHPVDKATFRALLKLIVTEFEGREVPVDAYSKINPENNSDIDICMSGLHRICRATLRRGTHSSAPKDGAQLKTQLIFLGMPESFAQDVSSALFGSRREIMLQQRFDSAPTTTVGGGAPLALLIGQNNVTWHLDVIRDPTNQRMRAGIAMDVMTADGKKHTFQIPPKEFHKMRLSIAEALKSLGELEGTYAT